ncbi:MAG: cupin domain-containing protein [Acidimicrobiia bacterium]|nr:cupin domain-containing protein [Acidimicrobiia bacterium]
MGVAEGFFASGIPGPPPHRHRWSEGFFNVSGQLRISVDGADGIFGPGEFAMADGGKLHTFAVGGDDPATFLATFSAGDGLAYLREMATVFTSDGPEPEALTELHQRYGVTVQR